LKNLNKLYLFKTDVSDVSSLEKLTKLKELNSVQTKVSPEAIDKLRKALPQGKILGP